MGLALIGPDQGGVCCVATPRTDPCALCGDCTPDWDLADPDLGGELVFSNRDECPDQIIDMCWRRIYFCDGEVFTEDDVTQEYVDLALENYTPAADERVYVVLVFFGSRTGLTAGNRVITNYGMTYYEEYVIHPT